MILSDPPFSRQPVTKGKLILVGRTYVPPDKQHGVYVPCWHLVRWSKPGRRRSDLWHFLVDSHLVTRRWAYRARCGAGKAWALRELTYLNAPTCERCLKGHG